MFNYISNECLRATLSWSLIRVGYQHKAAEIAQKNDIIMLLQETMVIDETYSKMVWRGNSKGCITLTNNDAIIEHIYQLDN
jgi:hypothetical protein